MASNDLTTEQITEKALETSNKEIDLNSVTSGVQYLTRGYIEYAQEVICNRALPDLYDGLKPVNRRILVTLKNSKSSGFTKSATVAGNTMALHPHGDSSIYTAMVLMTDTNGSYAFPLLKGDGNFGGVYKDDPPAASRYTEVGLHEFAEELFGNMNGINMIPNYDSTMTEPEVLPASFPLVLINSTSGIAVGFRSNMPSFNFNEVCDLVIEYIEKGKCETVITPDFVTGGYYIRNERELQKLMRTGNAKLKLRGKATIVDKEIHVSEVPFGKTIQSLIKQVNDKNIPSVRNAYDTDDFNGCGFVVDCTSKNRVNEALYALYKDTDFQYTYSADMTVVKNGAPVKLGVWGIIEEWVAWRKGVLEKEYKQRLESCKERARESSAFMTIINSDKKQELIRIITTEGKAAGKKFIRANWTKEEIPDDLIDFVSNRGLTTYYAGGKYADEYAKMQEEIAKLEDALADLNAVIVQQMNMLKSRYGTQLPRRTEITQTDFEFAEKETENGDVQKFVDTTKCYYTLKGGFLRKTRVAPEDKEAQQEFLGVSSDTLIAFDNRGRLIRIYCEELPMNSISDLGLYIPRYCNLNEDDDYKITWIGRMTGQTLVLLYKDGNIGFVDTNEWADNNRRVKVLERGISALSAQSLGAVISLEDMKKYFIFTDSTGRIGVANTEEIKRKDRTARTRAVALSKGVELDTYACVGSDYELAMTLANYDKYLGKMTKQSKGDWIGDASIFNNMF